MKLLLMASPLLLIAGSPAIAQPAGQSHEQHQQAAPGQQAGGDERCCCEEKMRQMMMQMMKDHQGMKMPSSGAGTPKAEPPADQHQH